MRQLQLNYLVQPHKYAAHASHCTKSAVTASRKYNVTATSHEMYSPAAGVRHIPLMYNVERGELWPIDCRFRFDFYFCDFGVSGTNRKVFLPGRRITKH